MKARIPDSFRTPFHFQSARNDEFRDNLVFKLRQNEVLNDFAKLRDDHYEKYVENLEKKVATQRKVLAKMRGENSAQASIAKRPMAKSKFHKLQHDKTFIQNVPKSHFYHLQAVEKLMTERGVLTTREQVDNFWANATKDKKLWSRPLPGHVDPDTITEIMVKKYSPGLSKNKQSQHSFHDTQPQDGANTASTSPDINLEKLLSQEIKLPPLHSLNSSVVPNCINVPAKEEEEQGDRIHPKLFKHRRKVEAYNIAMVNKGISSRLIKTHGLFDFTKGHKFETVTEKSHKIIDKKPDVNQNNTIKDSVFITEPVFGSDQVLIPDLEYKYAPKSHKQKTHQNKVQFSPQRKNRQEILEGANTEVQQHTNLPVLSYDMMMQNESNIKEAKVLSTLWRNYVDK